MLSLLTWSGRCPTTDATLLNWTAKEADGGIRRMVFHKAVCHHLCYSTFTRMTNKNTWSFIYADNWCIVTLGASFEKTESTLSDALDNIDKYYAGSHLHANPEKTDMRIPKQRSKVKAKTAARNIVLKKISTSKWGANPATIRTTVLAPIYSTVEYI